MRGIETFFASPDPSLSAEVRENVDDLVRRILDPHYDHGAFVAAVDCLKDNLPGAHRLFNGLSELFGTEEYGGWAHGCVINIYIKALRGAQPEVRDALEAKIRALPVDAIHPYRHGDIHQIFSVLRGSREERTPLAEFERLIERADGDALSKIIVVTSVDVQSRGFDERDYDYVDSELERIFPGLIRILAHPEADSRRMLQASASVTTMLEALSAHTAYRAKFARLVLNCVEQGLSSGETELAARALFIIRRCCGKEFDCALGEVAELERARGVVINPIIGAVLATPLERGNSDENRAV
jgi:hypothetical protein